MILFCGEWLALLAMFAASVWAAMEASAARASAWQTHSAINGIMGDLLEAMRHQTRSTTELLEILNHRIRRESTDEPNENWEND